MARKYKGNWRLQLLAALVLAGMIGGAWVWWSLRHWQPEREAWPVQGVEIGSDDTGVQWTALKAVGADFAYLDASVSAFAHDPAFIANLEGARAAGLQVGAVHRYDPCQPAERQAANFVIQVPRDDALLPPAVELELTADGCPVKVTDAAVLSELTTFINQVESHAGKAVILKLSRNFEQRYHVAGALDRNLWLVQDRFVPEYAGRPWMLWTANGALVTAAGAEPLRWVVVQP